MGRGTAGRPLALGERARRIQRSGLLRLLAARDPGGGLLPRHVDSVEETIVVIAGCAEVTVGDRAPQRVPAGGVALVPRSVPHCVRSVGAENLRFAAVYAAANVVTTYDDRVQPDGRRERRSAI